MKIHTIAAIPGDGSGKAKLVSDESSFFSMSAHLSFDGFAFQGFYRVSTILSASTRLWAPTRWKSACNSGS